MMTAYSLTHSLIPVSIWPLNGTFLSTMSLTIYQATVFLEIERVNINLTLPLPRSRATTIINNGTKTSNKDKSSYHAQRIYRYGRRIL
jgi:hypothetical protein